MEGCGGTVAALPPPPHTQPMAGVWWGADPSLPLLRPQGVRFPEGAGGGGASAMLPPNSGWGELACPKPPSLGGLGGGGVSCSFGVTDAPWWVGGGMGGLGGVGRAQSGLTAPPPPPQPAMQGGSEPDGGAGGGSWGCPTPTRLPACVNRAGLLPPAPPLGLGCCQNPEGGVPGEQCASLLDGGTEGGAPSDIPPCACAQASSRRSPSSPP